MSIRRDQGQLTELIKNDYRCPMPEIEDLLLIVADDT